MGAWRGRSTVDHLRQCQRRVQNWRGKNRGFDLKITVNSYRIVLPASAPASAPAVPARRRQRESTCAGRRSVSQRAPRPERPDSSSSPRPRTKTSTDGSSLSRRVPQKHDRAHRLLLDRGRPTHGRGAAAALAATSVLGRQRACCRSFWRVRGETTHTRSCVVQIETSCRSWICECEFYLKSTRKQKDGLIP